YSALCADQTARRVYEHIIEEGVMADESSKIEAKVKSFAKDLTDEVAELRKARLEKQKKSQGTDKKSKQASVPVVTFSLSQNKESKVRTPAEQALQVANGKSWVCWGSHMVDKARHVLMKVDGKVSWDAKKALGEDFEAFKKTWGELMK